MDGRAGTRKKRKNFHQTLDTLWTPLYPLKRGDGVGAARDEGFSGGAVATLLTTAGLDQ